MAAQAMETETREESEATAATSTRKYNLGELANDFYPVAAKWYTFGTMIGVSVEELDEIKGLDGLAQDCFHTVVRTWLKNGASCTKTALLKALKSNSVNRLDVARQIEANIAKEKFTTRDFGLLIEELSGLSADWNSFGIQLGFTWDELSGFKQKSSSVRLFLFETLNIWSQLGEPRSDLTDALRSKAVGYNNLAGQLEAKYGKEEEEAVDHR